MLQKSFRRKGEWEWCFGGRLQESILLSALNTIHQLNLIPLASLISLVLFVDHRKDCANVPKTYQQHVHLNTFRPLPWQLQNPLVFWCTWEILKLTRSPCDSWSTKVTAKKLDQNMKGRGRCYPYSRANWDIGLGGFEHWIVDSLFSSAKYVYFRRIMVILGLWPF